MLQHQHQKALRRHSLVQMDREEQQMKRKLQEQAEKLEEQLLEHTENNYK